MNSALKWYTIRKIENGYENEEGDIVDAQEVSKRYDEEVLDIGRYSDRQSAISVVERELEEEGFGRYVSLSKEVLSYMIIYESRGKYHSAAYWENFHLGYDGVTGEYVSGDGDTKTVGDTGVLVGYSDGVSLRKLIERTRRAIYRPY